MANSLGTLSAASLIIQRALELVFTVRPILGEITTDLSDSKALLNQAIVSRIHSVPSVSDFGSAANDKTDTDVSVTLNRFKQIKHTFTAAEYNATDRKLVDEAAEPIAIALANHMVDAVAALWLEANYTNETVEAVADTDYQTLVAARKALVTRGAPDARFGVVNSDVYAKLLQDDTVINASKNPGQSTIADGVIAGVAGFKKIYEYPALPATNFLTGFFGSKDSVVLASRVPQNPEEVLGTAKFPGSIGYITEPKTGLTVLVTEAIGEDLSISTRICWIYGVAKGNAAVGQRLVSEASA